MPSSIKLTDPLDILVEYGYLDEDKPYHKALNNAVMDFAENPDLGGEYNKDYVMLLQNEAKKELKLRRKKINVSKFFGKDQTTEAPAADTTGTGSLAVRKQTIDPSKLVSTPDPEKTQESLAIVVRGIDSIVETLKAEKKQDTKHFSFLRKMVERFKRRREENKLEFQIFDGLKKTATAALEPVKSAWQKLLEFLQNVILGRVLFKILEWMGNKDNQSKLESIIKFFKDWWPTLLAAYLLFGNSFGRMAVKLGVMVGKFAIKLVSKLIPKLVAGLAKLKAGALLKGGLVLGGAALITGAVLGAKALDGDFDQDKERTDEEKEADKEKVDSAMDMGVLSMNEGGIVPVSVTQGDTNIRSGTNMHQTGMNDPLGGGRFGLNKGGTVPGSGNKDTVPAMLTPGEFVMSKGAVQKYGASTLAGMNAAAGGTNKPTLMGGYKEGGFANITNTMTSSSSNSDGNFSVGINYVAPEEAKERVAAMGMPSMELMDGTVVPDFGKMGGEKVTQGLQLTRDIMVQNEAPPQKIAQIDELMAMPDAQPESIATKINQIVPGSMENTMMNVGDSITASARMNGGGLVQYFQGGGQVQRVQMGRGAAKRRMEASKIKPIKKKKVTVAYAEEKQNMADKPNTGKSEQEIPSFNVTAMRSPEKIKVLGISV
tara:strand:- start:4306 stop:6273 length:1968 start_codon:yes stop_codon:yes gene_type:complete